MRVGSFLILMVLFGAMYTFPALNPTMAEEFGTSRTVLQGAFAIWGLVVAACSPLTGRLVDRYPLRHLLMAGSIGLLLTLLGLGVAQAPWQIYLTLIGLGAPAYALLQVGTIVAASRTGAESRGGSLGVAGAGIGVGLTLLLPSAIWLNEIIGWRAVWFALAGLTVAINVPVSFLAPAVSAVATQDTVSQSSWKLLGTRPFLLLFIGGIGVALVDEVLYQHLVPHLTAAGLSSGSAGTVLGCVSLGYISGQVLGGSLSDRWGRWAVGLCAATLAGTALAIFALLSPGFIGLIVVALVAGLGLGATLAIRSAALADLFDGPSLGFITGAYQWAYALGAALMGWAGAYTYERLGSYGPIFLIGAVAALVWAMCLKGALMSRISFSLMAKAPSLEINQRR